MINKSRIENFFARFPLLLSTITKLNEATIPWMIGGSGCLYIFGNERLPDDIDIFIRDKDHDQVDTIFGIKSYIYRSALEHVRNSNPQGNHVMQITSHLELHIGQKEYHLSLRDKIFENSHKAIFNNQGIWFMPPEEVLLFKALLQRGADVGKKDLEDIGNFLRIYNIDRKYLESRIASLDAKDRVGDIFGSSPSYS